MFVNGADEDAIATRWRCINADRPEASLVVAFLDDGSGELVFDRAPDTRSIDWVESQAASVEFRWGDERDDGFRFDGIRFGSDTRFSAAAVVPKDTRAVRESDVFDDDVPVGTFDCSLQDVEGRVLSSAPFETAEGPAAWPRPEPIESGPLPAIEGLYVLYESGFIGGSFQNVVRLAMAFDDGTVTRGVTDVFENGVALSRRDNPGRWGRWRGSASNGEDFELDMDEDGDFTSTTAQRTTRQPAGTMLDGCYSASSTVSYGDPFGGTFSTRQFCFAPNGVFGHSSFSSTLTPDATIGSGSDSRGTYRVDGYTIELRYGNGAVVRQLFGNFGALVSIGGSVFL